MEALSFVCSTGFNILTFDDAVKITGIYQINIITNLKKYSEVCNSNIEHDWD